MESKSNEIKVGVMIFAAIVILAIFLFVIFGVNFTKDTKEYQTSISYIGGIAEGSLVKFGGMNVGLVSEIRLPDPEKEQTKINLKLNVNQKTPVRVDSKAFVTSVGITAEQHVEITPGSPDAPLLPGGSVLEGKEVLSFTQMAEPLGELSAQMQELMDRVNAIFDEENREHFASIIENTDKLLMEGGGEFVRLVQNLEKLTANLTEVSQDLNKLMEKNSETFDKTLAHLEATTKETAELIADLRTTVTKFQGMMSANGTSIVEIMENFQFASQNLEEFTRAVKEQPWLLVRKAAPPERKLP